MEDASQSAASDPKKNTASFSSWRNILAGVAAVTKLITGPLFALGGGTLIASLSATASPFLAPIATGLLAVGTVSLFTALVTTYISSSIERASNEERDERKAMLAAKYLVKELNENNLCVTEKQQPAPEPDCACKQKNWSKAVTATPEVTAEHGRTA